MAILTHNCGLAPHDNYTDSSQRADMMQRCCKRQLKRELSEAYQESNLVNDGDEQ